MKINEEALKLRIILHKSQPKALIKLWSPKHEDFKPELSNVRIIYNVSELYLQTFYRPQKILLKKLI
jgi:hypothetical protein